MIENWMIKTQFGTKGFIVEQNLRDEPKKGNGTTCPIPCTDYYFPSLREVHIWICDTMQEAIEKVPEKFHKDMGLTN